MKSHIPKILLYSRLVFAIIIIGFTFILPSYSRTIVIFIMYIGILSDVFDGIIARRFNLSTDKFRVHDTIVDLIFYISILSFLIVIEPETFRDNKIVLIAILALEFLMYSLSLVKFKKLPSPHAILSKFWGIYIVIEFTLILLRIKGTHFTIALFIGLIVHLDRVLIYLILRKWEHDIPSCYHAYRLRKGLKIKRVKLFNG